MGKRARILLAGTFIAIAPCGIATSQAAPATVLNSQVQLGDVFSQQTLNVVTVSDTTRAITTATGNGLDTGTERNDLNMRSTQTQSGAVGADTVTNVAEHAGASASLTTKATGNVGDANVFAGTLSGVYHQTTDGPSVAAHSTTAATNAGVGDLTSSTQAVGNSQGLGISYGAAGVRTTQTNSANVVSEDHSDFAYSSGTAVVSSGASANNLTLSGVGGSAERVIASQSSLSNVVQALAFSKLGQAQQVTVAATTAANTINAVNNGPLLDATIRQDNQAYVGAHADISADLYGSASAVAYGVGNTAVAGDVGGEVIVDNIQSNSGDGIEVVAHQSGSDGYDGLASATATGNAVTGYSCSTCSGKLTASIQQTNETAILSYSTAEANTGRSVTGVSTAVGNTATFYISKPNN